jgi:hypothetical protein
MPELQKKRTRGKSKLSKDMKEIIHLAFERAGGVDYLVEQARSEPKAFMGLLGRIVPNEVRLDVLVALDLGSAMLENERNLQRLNSVTIDAIPETPNDVTKPLITKDNKV